MKAEIKVEYFYPKKSERTVYNIESEPLTVEKKIETKYAMSISSHNHGKYFYMRFDEYPSGPYEIFLAGTKIASGEIKYLGTKNGVRYWVDGENKTFSYEYSTQIFTIAIKEGK